MCIRDSLNCGQVRGPVQLGFARSIDPILPQEVTITRVAITTEADAEKKGTEMGRKHIVPYGMYRVEGYVSANLARKTTGFSEEDLNMLWEAILNMFEHDHSAARGKMAVRDLIIFRHDSELGNAPSYKLFDKVKVARNEGVIAPRSYADYTVTVEEDLPAGVTCERRSRCSAKRSTCPFRASSTFASAGGSGRSSTWKNSGPKTAARQKAGWNMRAATTKASMSAGGIF